MNEDKKRKSHSPEFKANAVKLALEKGNAAQAARELRIGYSLLQSWILASQNAASRGKGLQQSIEDQIEVDRLRKRNAELEEELEILKKATAYFARERLTRNTPGSKK